MTVHTLQSAAPALDLTGGMYLRLEAIDASTGAAVTGVTVAQVAVYGVPLFRLDLEDVAVELVAVELEGLNE